MPSVQNPNIPGVQVRIFVHGTKTEITPDENGFIGKLTPQKLKLAVWVTGDEIEVLSVIPESSGFQSVRFMKNHAKDKEGVEEGPDRFAQKVQVHIGSPPRIAGNQNRMVLTEPLGAGRLRIHELSLAGDLGEFFLVHQAEELQVYRGESELALPTLSGWRFEPGMLEEILGGLGASMILPSMKDFRYPATPSLKGLGDKEGIIDWWSDARGCGTMLTKKHKHDVVIRRESFAGHVPGHLNTLVRGQKVAFSHISKVTPHNSRNYFEQAFGLNPLQEAPAQAVV